MLAQLPKQHYVHPNQIGDLNDQLLTRAANVRCANDVLQFESRWIVARFAFDRILVCGGSGSNPAALRRR